MGFKDDKDDYEYYDDDDYNDEDDEEYLDYSEGDSKSGSRPSSGTFNRGLPGSGSSRLGGRIGARADDDDEEDEEEDDGLANRFNSGNRFGSGSRLGNTPTTPSAGSDSRFSSGSRFSSSSSSTPEKKDDSSSANRFGSNRFGSSTPSSPVGGGTSRFSTGGGDKKEDEKSSTNRFGSPSRFGTSSSSSDKKDDDSSARSGTNRFSSSSSSTPEKKDDSSSRFGSNRFGSSSSSTPEKKEEDKKATGTFSSSRFGSSSTTSSTPEKKDDSSNRFGSNRFGSSSSSSSSSVKKEEEKKPTNTFGSRFGNNSSSTPDKKDDKKAPAATTKDEKKAGESGGVGGMFNNLRSKLPIGGNTDAKAGDKKDDKKPGGGASLGGILGGVTSAIGGNKSGDKKDDKKPGEASSGGVGGMFNNLKSKLPIGGNTDTKAPDKKDNKPADNKASGAASGSGGRFGNFSNPFGAKKDEAKPGDKKATSTTSAVGGATSAKPSSFGVNKFGAQTSDKKDDVKPADDAKKPQSAFGRFGRTEEKADDKAAGAKSTKAATADAAASGGFFGRISSGVSGIFNRGEDKSTATKSRAKSAKATSKVPTTTTDDGLTLDNWLDILGVSLTFGSLVLFFSAISREQAAISRLHVTFGQLFGWGALAVPITMFVIGLWLIVRHFGDEAPKIDPIRVTGIVMGFVSLLVFFQYIHAFDYVDVLASATDRTILDELLKARLRYAWEGEQAGGGIVGAQIYYFLFTNITEIGGFLLNVFLMLISIMLVTRLTAAQIVTVIAGVGLTFRGWTQQEAERRRAERQIAAQRAAELAAQQQLQMQQQSQQPQPEVMAAQTMPAQYEPATAGIRMNIGGQAMPSTANMPQTQPAPTLTSGGLFSRMRGGNKPKETNGNGTIAAAVGSIFGASNNGSNTGQPTPPPLPEAPLPMDDDYSHLDNQPYRPAAQSSNPNTIRLGDMLKPPPTPSAQGQATNYGDTPATPQQPAASMPEQPAANFTPMGAPEDVIDPVKARQERLNALRQGKAGPLSPAGMAQARQEDTPETRAIPIGRDPLTPPIATPKPEFTPPSQLPSAQPQDTGMYQQRLSEPVSSAVTNQTRPKAEWRLPDYRTLLSSGSEQEFDREHLLKQAKIIEETLEAFGAPGRVVEVNTGPVITQFGVEPDYMQGRSGKKQRVKVGAIAALDKDLQLALGAKSIRVEAPVPGKGYVGIEVPNAEPTLVSLRDIMDTPSFSKHKSPLAIALGQSVSGAPISADLAVMPHLLIAGTTGSGKSVCVNSIIASILALHTPDEVKFIMIDPKRVELTGYNGIPHLIAPVVVELERIVGVLKWVTREMDDRYKKFSDAGARNIEDYNKHRDTATIERMPYIVVIIDELADLMMLAPEETERTITRIAALARATGIHLVIATQRPSVDVVTGLIKANFPARIAFAVAGGVDSRVILDQPGAERLLGRGDMLYLSGDSPAALRLQGVYVSDMEINNIVRYWKMQSLKQPELQPIALSPSFKPTNSVALKPRTEQKAFWDSTSAPPPTIAPVRPAPSFSGFEAEDEEDEEFDEFDGELTDGELSGDVEDGAEDELYEKSVELVRRLDKASISLLQRRLRIGYTRAARLIDVMEARGVVGPAKDGSSKPRDVLP
jgi:S-DNA-T family DNA segregation ATPase FtsK/SpoIIIE